MIGKYSPTVQGRYDRDQDWHHKAACGAVLDPEGYDSYGYDSTGEDRAGHREEDYNSDEELYHQVLTEWWEK